MPGCRGAGRFKTPTKRTRHEPTGAPIPSPARFRLPVGQSQVRHSNRVSTRRPSTAGSAAPGPTATPLSSAPPAWASPTTICHGCQSGTPRGWWSATPATGEPCSATSRPGHWSAPAPRIKGSPLQVDAEAIARFADAMHAWQFGAERFMGRPIEYQDRRQGSAPVGRAPEPGSTPEEHVRGDGGAVITRFGRGVRGEESDIFVRRSHTTPP
jgi:hypothetical protein